MISLRDIEEAQLSTIGRGVNWLRKRKEDIRKENNYEVMMFEAITWKKRLTFLERRRRRRRKINNYASYVDEREIRSGFEKSMI